MPVNTWASIPNAAGSFFRSICTSDDGLRLIVVIDADVLAVNSTFTTTQPILTAETGTVPLVACNSDASTVYIAYISQGASYLASYSVTWSGNIPTAVGVTPVIIDDTYPTGSFRSLVCSKINGVVACSYTNSLVYVYSGGQPSGYSSSVPGDVGGAFYNLACDRTGDNIYVVYNKVLNSTNYPGIARSVTLGYDWDYPNDTRFDGYGLDSDSVITCSSDGQKAAVTSENTNLIYITTDSFVADISYAMPGNISTISSDATMIYILLGKGGNNDNIVYLSSTTGSTYDAQVLPGLTNTNGFAIATISQDSLQLYASTNITTGTGTGVYSLTRQNIVCFKEDTKILCSINGEEAYVPIQILRKGTLVKTSSNGYKAIEMIGQSTIEHNALANRIKDQLYVCTKENYPEITDDLVITGSHCILVDKFTDEEQKKKTVKVNGKVYVTDGKYRLPACVDDRAAVYPEKGTFTIYHFALENTNYLMNYGVYANGLLVETSSRRYMKELSKMSLIE